MPDSSFRVVLQEALDSRGYTPGDAARLMKQKGEALDRSTISRWLNGDNLPSPRHLLTLSRMPDILGLSPEEAQRFRDGCATTLGIETRAGRLAAAPLILPHRLHYGTDTLSPFAGRTAELARLREMVRQRRSVTICGMAGTGKTRLAQELLRESVADFAHGCEFLDVSHHQDATQVLHNIADLLKLDLEPGSFAPENREALLDDMGRRLHGVSLLVLVDNVSRPAQVARLAARLVDIVWVFTTRRAIPLGGNSQLVRIAPPKEDDARAIFRAYLLSGADTAEPHELDDIVNRLGRLPLALRLAAAMVNNRVVDGLPGLRRLLIRQGITQTTIRTRLNRLFDETVAVLPPSTQRVYEVCGIFSNATFSLSRIQDVCLRAAIQPSPADWNTLEEYSLVSQPDPERVELHDLVHAHAAQRLQRSPALAEIEEACKQSYLATVKAHYTPEEAWDRNYRILTADEQDLLRVADELHRRRDTERLRELWLGLSSYLWTVGNIHAFERFDEHCLQAAERAGDDEWRAVLLSELGYARQLMEDWTSAEAFFRQSQLIHDGMADQMLEQARLRRYRAVAAAYANDFAAAMRLMTEADARLEEVDPADPRLPVARVFYYSALMTIHHRAGDLAEAEEIGQAALQQFWVWPGRRPDSRVGDFRLELGDITLKLRQPAAARALWSEMLDGLSGLRLIPEMAECRLRMAWLAGVNGDWATAATEATAAADIFGRHGKLSRRAIAEELLGRATLRAPMPPFNDILGTYI